MRWLKKLNYPLILFLVITITVALLFILTLVGGPAYDSNGAVFSQINSGLTPSSVIRNP
jgi:hypothetical protein